MKLYFKDTTANFDNQINPLLNDLGKASAEPFSFTYPVTHALIWGHKIYYFTSTSGLVSTNTKKYLVTKKINGFDPDYKKSKVIASIEVEKIGDGLNTKYKLTKYTTSQGRRNLFFDKICKLVSMESPGSGDSWSPHAVVVPELDQIYVMLESKYAKSNPCYKYLYSLVGDEGPITFEELFRKIESVKNSNKEQNPLKEQKREVVAAHG